MDDTISRQEAIDVLRGYFDGMLETDTVCPSDLYGLFEVIPAAPVREVVLCKDCKNYREYGCQRVFVYPEPDDFCSRGERRDG